MSGLWFTDQWTDETKFSIKVKTQLHKEYTGFQQAEFFDSDEYGRFFTLDGYMMMTEKDEFMYHDMIVHVPMACNPQIKTVLVIGGGDGATVRELTRYKHLEKIVMVDIDERVVHLCQEFIPSTSSKLTDPRVTLLFQDGVKFVEESADHSYDLIIVDSTEPISVGEGLFSTEFYKNCHRILADHGILINQHESPYYDFFAKAMKKAHDKLKNIFPISKVYQLYVPTYPSGHWLFGFASKHIDPIDDHQPEKWEQFGLKTKYYNSDIHKASFALPTYVKEMLDKSKDND
ncbi:MAG: polyamine aminopropyltransferase [Brevinema sp.]